MCTAGYGAGDSRSDPCPERSKKDQRIGADRHWPGLADGRLKVWWMWKLQGVSQTASLWSELPRWYLRCTPPVEEEDYDMYSIHCDHLIFKRRTVPTPESTFPSLCACLPPGPNSYSALHGTVHLWTFQELCLLTISEYRLWDNKESTLS
jgi:hypothetical protein